VLKLFHPSVSAESIEKEYRTNQLLKETGIRMPLVHGMKSVNGKRGIVFEGINGAVMTTLLAQRPLKVVTLAKKLAHIHHEIHQQHCEALPSFKESLKTDIMATGLDEDRKKTLLTLLKRVADDTAVCHADFHPDNLLIGRERHHVIDWLDASKGHPLLDVARTKMLIGLSALPDGLSGFKRIMIRWLRRKFLRSYLKTYFNLSGLDRTELSDYEPLLLAARLAENLPQKERRRLEAALDSHFKQE